jgi:hypothetical protein
VAVDCIEGLPVPEVDFAFQGGDTPAPLDLGITASADDGSVPLQVDFGGTGGTKGTTYLWDFGDGTDDVGEAVAHTFVAPGLFPVVLQALAPGSTGFALHLVTVGGAGGAGPGTTPPADTLLAASKVNLKRNLKQAGKDTVKLVGSIVLPEGFVPGAHAIEVSVAGVTLGFTLDEKNKGLDASGNKVKLKYKRPKGDPPLPAGVEAKLTAKLKGDFALPLEAAGIRDASVERALLGAPLALLLNELVYRGAADLTVKSKLGKKGKAKLLPQP